MLSDVSLTVTVQVGLNTQLMAGALTFTTFNGTAATTTGKHNAKASASFCMIYSLPPKFATMSGGLAKGNHVLFFTALRCLHLSRTGKKQSPDSFQQLATAERF